MLELANKLGVSDADVRQALWEADWDLEEAENILKLKIFKKGE